MQFSVESWMDDGEGTEGSAWSELDQRLGWTQFAELVGVMVVENAFRDPTWRVCMFRRARAGLKRELVAQAWIDHHSEVQVRVSAGYAPMVRIPRQFAMV